MSTIEISDATSSTRKVAWAVAGTSLVRKADGEQMTRAEITEHADLDWTVEQHTLTANAITPDGVGVDLPEHRALVRRNRDGSASGLGVRKTGYVPIQNDEMLDVMEATAATAGAVWDSAGVLRGGRGVFAAITLPQHTLIGGVDAIGWTLLGRNYHDGSGAFTISATPVRLRCTNMMRSALRSATATVTIRHTKSAPDRLSVAREALGLTTDYAAEWAAWADRLVAEQMSRAEYVTLVERLVPVKDATTERVQRNARDAQDALLALWSAPTQANVAGTRWAALNAVAEYDEWFRPTRGNGAPDVARATRTIDGGMGSLAERAARLLTPA